MLVPELSLKGAAVLGQTVGGGGDTRRITSVQPDRGNVNVKTKQLMTHEASDKIQTLTKISS